MINKYDLMDLNRILYYMIIEYIFFLGIRKIFIKVDYIKFDYNVSFYVF